MINAQQFNYDGTIMYPPASGAPPFYQQYQTFPPQQQTYSPVFIPSQQQQFNNNMNPQIYQPAFPQDGMNVIQQPSSEPRVLAAQANRGCDITQDVLLIDDMDDDGTRRSYLRCQPTGAGLGSGYWQRRECSSGTRFDFQVITQSL